MIGVIALIVCAAMTAVNIGMYVWTGSPWSLGGAIFCGIVWSFLNWWAIRQMPGPYTILSEPYKEPEPICGCTHHQCFHDENGCGNVSYRYNSSMIDNQVTISCGCRGYMGPEHLPTVLP